MISDDTIKSITRALQLRDTSVLNEERKNLLEFFSFADDAIRHYGQGKCIPVIMEKFGCSRSTAYEYRDYAQKVFGTTYTFEKNYNRSILLEQYDEMILIGIRSCISEVIVSGPDEPEKKEIRVIDWRVYASVMKYMEGKERLLQLDAEEPPFDPSDLNKMPRLRLHPSDLGITGDSFSEKVKAILLKHGGRRLLPK